MDKTTMVTSKQELISLPVPNQTNRYKPVSYEQLINLTLEGMDKAGYKLKEEVYRSAEGRQIATGYYDFDYSPDPEMGIRMAWQNSYNKKVSLKIVIGTFCFVCTNGCFIGDMGAFRTKHVGEVQTVTPSKIQEFISGAEGTYSRISGDKNQMKELEVTKKTLAELVGDLFINEQLITSDQLGIIKGEIENPSYSYGAPGSVWELYSHFTHAGKRTHPTNYIQYHQKLHDYFTQRFNLNSKTEATAIYVSLPQ
jgi:hypothetical protein